MAIMEIPLRMALLAATCLASGGSLLAQSPPTPAAFTSSVPAGQTEGYNILFFGNSFTISASNPAVSSPTYGGARGVPEIVRQIAIAAEQAPPFVKNVYHLGQGYDYHVSAFNSISLANINEPLLQGETWDFVVMQGYSTRPTDHPYLGNASKHKSNGLKLFNEVRAGSTNHTLQSPDVIPVLYQTWSRHPDHWFFDLSSPYTAGTSIPFPLGMWQLGTIFKDSAEMASQVRSGYDQTRQYIDADVPDVATRIARAGDAWEAANWGVGWKLLYAADRYHAGSRGDLLTALMIYAAIYEETATGPIIASGNLDDVLAAINVTAADAAQLASWADAVLINPPPAAEPAVPPTGIIVDFSNVLGVLLGAEDLPVPGRYYNAIANFRAGAVINAVDTTNTRTGVDILITDGFATQSSNGATGAWNSHRGITGSLYHDTAQQDSFRLNQEDRTAQVEVRGLNPDRLYRFKFHGSVEGFNPGDFTYFTIGLQTVGLRTVNNMNITATFPRVAPDSNGTVKIEVSIPDLGNNNGYLGVMEITRALLDGQVRSR